MTTDLLPTDALPLPVVLTGGVAVVLTTAGLLSARAATRPDLPASRWHRDLPAVMATALDHRGVRALALGWVLVGLGVLAGRDGPVDATTGFAVLTAAALLAGPLARSVNPVRLAATRPPEPADDARGPGWPAVAVLALLGVIALTVHDGRVLAAVGGGYLAVQATLCRLRGQGWVTTADGIEALATLIGHVAPLGRRDDGRLAWRNPVVHTAHLGLPPTALWLGAVVVGLTVASVATAAVPVFVAVTVAAGGVLRLGLIRPWFYGAAVPLTAAYGLLVGGRWLEPLDLAVFVAAHAMAVAVLHRQAIARHDPRTARAVQFPARAVVVASVAAGLAVVAPT